MSHHVGIDWLKLGGGGDERRADLIEVEVSVFSTQPSLAKKTGRQTTPPKGGGGWYREVSKGVTIITETFFCYLGVSVVLTHHRRKDFLDGNGDVNTLHNY